MPPHQPMNTDAGEAKARPALMDYLDYRLYMRDYMAWQKKKDNAFSFRVFALRSGIPASSASFICRVISGRRTLTTERRLEIAKGMGLSGDASRYFHALVQFNQAKSMETKNHFFLELTKYSGSRTKVIGADQFQFYGHWLNQALWAYFGMDRNQKNPAAIAQRIRPAISEAQIQGAIDLLLRLKLIKKLANGYAPTDTQISTPKEIRDLAAKRQLREMIGLSLQALDQVPAKHREYNSLTMYMSRKGFEAIKERIGSFREELRALLESDRDEDRIYTLTMQLFPNTVIDE
jgi:uncharacterized protein (TIGR02147 family)